MRVRHLLAAAILLGAAAVRLIGLGWPELTPDEASSAVSAIAGTPVASPYPVELDGSPVSPAYASLSRPLMVTFGARTSTARLIPAIAGVALVGCPLFLLTFIGWPTALFAMGFLAVSPSLVTTARTASGETLALLGAVGAVIALLHAYRNQKAGPWAAAGAFAGLALASGPPVWSGMVGLALAALLARRWAPDALPDGAPEVANGRWSIALGTGLVAFTALSTSFFRDVSLVPGAIAGPGRWIAGWSPFAVDPPLRTSPLLLLPEALVFVVAAVWILTQRGELRSRHRALALWWAISLTLFVLYPARMPATLTWVVLPAALLAAHGLPQLVDLARESADDEIVWIMAVAASSVVFFALFLFQRYGPVWQGVDPLERLGLLVSLVGITVGGGLVVWWGWGTRVLGRSLALAALALLTLWNVGQMSEPNFGQAAASPMGLWRGRTTPDSASLLVRTIEEISQASIGRRDSLTVDVRGQRSAQIAWLLREFEPSDPEDDFTVSPPIILVQEGQPLPATADAYIGQNLVMTERRGYSSGVGESMRVLAGRPVPPLPSLWTVFVRSDLAGLPEGESSGSVQP